jgi:hypothetical protein
MEEKGFEELCDIIMEARVECPECGFFADEWYTCGTCWCIGGCGSINIFGWLKEHKDRLLK